MDRRELLRGLGGLGLLAALAGCAPSYPSLQLKIATGSVGGPYNTLGTALAKAWDDELGPATPSLVRPTDGSRENVSLLQSREVNVAISQLDVAAETVAGSSTTDPKGLRALARIYDDVVHLVVPLGSPITSMTQLRGRTVSVGAPNSGVRFAAQRLLQAVGMSITTDLRAEYFGIADSVKALQAGRIEAFFWSGGLPTKNITDLAKAMPVSLVDLAQDDVVQRVQAVYPVFYAPRRIAADTYPGIDKPLTALSIRNLLLVRAEMPDDLARDLVKTLFTRQAQIAREIPAALTPTALTIDTRRAIGTAPVDLHPGAEQGLREAKDDG